MSLVHHDVSNCWRLFAQQPVRVNNTENIKAPYHWPFRTGIHKDQWCWALVSNLWQFNCLSNRFSGQQYRKHQNSSPLAIFEQETTSDSWILLTKVLSCSKIHNLHWLFNSLFRITTSKKSKLHITGSLKGEATRNWLIHLTKNLLCKALVLNFHHLDCLFNSLFRLAPRKKSKLHTTGYLLRKSTSDGWFIHKTDCDADLVPAN